MKKLAEILVSMSFTFLVSAAPVGQGNSPMVPVQPSLETKQVLASQEFSLRNRYQEQSVNDIFADNILLALAYMDGARYTSESVDWNAIREPNQTEFILNPGETFAFHDNLQPERAESVVQTTNARFIASEGFKHDGFIVGDGVCHLASFINVLASQAGLEVYAPVRHDFATIPNIDREFGTSINSGGTIQNLYVTNTTNTPVAFVFDHSFESIKIRVESV